MFIVILIAALSIAAISGTIAVLRDDDFRPLPTDPSRLRRS
jgi:hypothetical protein